MNSKERLEARLQGKPVDKIPNLNIAMALVAKCAGVSYREYAQDYRKLVEGNLICAEKFGFDSVSAISDPMREASAFGAAVTFPENAVPYSLPELFHDGYDRSLLKTGSPYDSERTLDRIKAVELLHEKAGKDFPVIGWVEGVLAECADLRGVSELMFDLGSGRGIPLRADGACACPAEGLCQGPGGRGGRISSAWENAVASLIGPSLYEEYAFAYDKAIVDYVHSLGAKVKLHICGNITALLPQLREVAPDILDLDWMVDYKTAADMMQGAPISVNGNLDPVAVMLSGTVEEVEQKTRECIAAGNQTSLLAAGCEVPADTPEENLLAMDRLLYLS